jgi:phosphinothricin acetyltransferase
MRADDWPVVAQIYAAGIATGTATFETCIPEWEEWNRAHLPFGRLVARRRGNVEGWAALSAVSDRCVYGGVAEVSVYVAENSRGIGLGGLLLRTLVLESEKSGIWTLQAGILADNAASIAVHRGCGFREVGKRERIGRLNGAWRDVILMERRSATVGTDNDCEGELPSEDHC